MQTEVVIVTGQRGNGKTTWARNYIKSLNRVIVLDKQAFEEFGVPLSPNFPALVKAVEGKSFFRASYAPHTFEIPVMFDLARVVGNCHLVLEEADQLDDPRSFLEYDEAISRGRHYGVSIVAISLFPTKLPYALRTQATRLICFRQLEPRAINTVAEIIGDDGLRLPSLQKFHYLDWTPENGSVEKKLDMNGLIK